MLERFRQLYEQGGDPGRLLIWRDSLAQLTPLGYGAGSFPAAFARATPYFMRKSVDSGHGDYVEWAVEFGPWFAALFAISLAVAVVLLLRKAYRIADPERRAIALGANFGSAALALHSLTDSILHFPALLLLLAALLGLASGLAAPNFERRQRLGTGLLSAGLCAATLYLAGAFAQLNFAEQFTAARGNQLDADAASARQSYAAALRANPHAAAAWLGLAELARGEGAPELAVRYVHAARSVEPFTYRVEWALADLQLATGDIGGGVERLRMVCEQLTDLRPAAYLLAYRAGASLAMIERRLTVPEPYAVGEYLAFLIRTGNTQRVPGARHRLAEIQGVTLSEAHRRYIARHVR